MDAKVTLSFNESVIRDAKAYAEKQGLSLSRLTEVLLRKLVADNPASLEDYPVSDWVLKVAEGEATYRSKPRTNKELRSSIREKK